MSGAGFDQILRRYGEEVALPKSSFRAVVRPLLNREDDQSDPTVLGRLDRFRLLC